MNNQKKYWKSHVDPTWNDYHKTLDYQYLSHKDEIMVQQWRDQGYPDSLILNGAVYSFRDNLPDFIKPLSLDLGWHDIGMQMFRMATGDIIPIHKDHYIAYMRALNLPDSHRVWRALIFLEDWKSGHYFEIDGEPWLNWKAGDYVVWNNDVPHMAANVGIEPRYTMQITGWL